RALLIDTGINGAGPRVRDALPRYGVQFSDIALILITHAHSDHAGGLAYLKKRLHAPVAIHHLEAEALREGRSQRAEPQGMLGQLAAPLVHLGQRYAGVPADVLIEERLDLAPYGLHGQIIWTPGHTPGSTSVILESGEAIVGDLIMGQVLRPHLPRYPFLAADMDQVRSSIKAVLACHPKVIYAAHGGPFDPDDVRRRLG
ncbi:MAG: MBL fold metallo-hydrolase, partial [Chloroflexi bacterium]|nr:MBL fold metallo-hydrolase [Chloroflexota bacterium]